MHSPANSDLIEAGERKGDLEWKIVELVGGRVIGQKTLYLGRIAGFSAIGEFWEPPPNRKSRPLSGVSGRDVA